MQIRNISEIYNLARIVYKVLAKEYTVAKETDMIQKVSRVLHWGSGKDDLRTHQEFQTYGTRVQRYQSIPLSIDKETPGDPAHSGLPRELVPRGSFHHD